MFKRKKTVTREKHVSCGCAEGQATAGDTRGAGEEVGGEGHVTGTKWKGVIIVNDSGKSCGTLEVNDNESC